MIKLGIIERIPFEFNEGKISSNLFQGLRDYGPFDLETRAFKKLEIDVLVPFNKEGLIRDFMNNLKYAFNSLFSIEDVWYTLHPFRKVEDIIYDENLSRKPDIPTTNKPQI
ncbi:MAG: hypothetical protein ACFFAU_10965 [Candidatus Hodarchaeota archaeon]